jgi:hypothetical protein
MQFNDLPPECIAVGICPYLNSRVKMSGPLQRIKSSHDLTIEPLSASTGVSAIGKRNRAFDGPELAELRQFAGLLARPKDTAVRRRLRWRRRGPNRIATLPSSGTRFYARRSNAQLDAIARHRRSPFVSQRVFAAIRGVGNKRILPTI